MLPSLGTIDRAFTAGGGLFCDMQNPNNYYIEMCYQIRRGSSNQRRATSDRLPARCVITCGKNFKWQCLGR